MLMAIGGGEWNQKETILAFCVIFPFAQVVPLFLWLETYDFEWMKSFKKRVKMESGNTGVYANDDPLYRAIKLKVEKHCGFIMESFLESVPQSILQLVAIVVLERVTTFNVFSLTVSIISVASKSYLLSWSPNYKCFLWNYLCFAIDVFCVFSTVAWLFYFIPGSFGSEDAYHFLFLNLDLDVFSLIWFWKVLVMFAYPLACLILFFTVIFTDILYSAVKVVIDMCKEGRCRCREACEDCKEEWCDEDDGCCCCCSRDRCCTFECARISIFVPCYIITYISIAAICCLLGLMVSIPLLIIIEGLKLSHYPGWINSHSTFDPSGDVCYTRRVVYDWALYGSGSKNKSTSTPTTFIQRVHAVLALNRACHDDYQLLKDSVGTERESYLIQCCDEELKANFSKLTPGSNFVSYYVEFTKQHLENYDDFEDDDMPLSNLMYVYVYVLFWGWGSWWRGVPLMIRAIRVYQGINCGVVHCFKSFDNNQTNYEYVYIIGLGF